MKKGSAVFCKDYKIGEVDRRLFGSFVEHLGRCLYDGVYQRNGKNTDKNGFREDVKELIQELGVTAIRYPGGNFVSGYDWKDGIGSKESRPHRRELAWHTIETNEVGTDEFSQYLEEIGVDMMMAINLGTGTPKDAGELVDYCNTESGTYFSDLRKKNGREEPYNIKMWCVGNEMDGEWQIAMKTAEEYARACKEASKIVKWMEPKAEVIACGTCTNEVGHTSYGDWDRTVLEECYDYIDYLSLHRYYNYDPQKHLFYDIKQTEKDIPFFFTDLRSFLDTIIGVCDFVKGKKHSNKTIDISFDEWGVITDAGAVPGKAGQEFGHASFKQLDAVIYGGILCTFLNYANRVKIACQSLLVNEGGMITTDPNGKAIRQTTFYPFKHVSDYGRGTALQGVMHFPKAETEHYGEHETAVGAAVYNEEESTVTVFVANCDMSDSLTLDLNLQQFGAVKGIEWIELYDENPYAKNTFEDEFAVIPVQKDLPDTEDGKTSVVLKEHSWNVLRFKCEN